MSAEFKNGYVPIEDASTETARFVVTLPEFLPRGCIRVNLKNLDRLCKIGGISHLRVVGETDGDTTKFTPTIVGYDSLGNAYAGKKGEKISVPPFTTSHDESNDSLDTSWSRPHSAVWVNRTVGLNINEIQERIREEKAWPRGVYSTQAWAHHLDKSLREGIGGIGVKHLALGLNRKNWAMASLQYGLMGFFEAQSSHPSIESMTFRILFVGGLLNLMAYFAYRNTDDGSRWSLFYGPQLDLALAIKILSKRINLVKDFPESSNSNNQRGLPPSRWSGPRPTF